MQSSEPAAVLCLQFWGCLRFRWLLERVVADRDAFFICTMKNRGANSIAAECSGFIRLVSGCCDTSIFSQRIEQILIYVHMHYRVV